MNLTHKKSLDEFGFFFVTGSKHCISEPQNLVKAIREAISDQETKTIKRERPSESQKGFTTEDKKNYENDSNTVKCDSNPSNAGIRYEDCYNRQKISKC